MNAILTADVQRSYTSQLQSFPFPLGWVKLQSPAHHLDSYRIQEHARASIVIPTLLRCWLMRQRCRGEGFDMYGVRVTWKAKEDSHEK